MLKKSGLFIALGLTVLGTLDWDMVAGPKEWIAFITQKQQAGESFTLGEISGFFDDIPMPKNIKKKFLDLRINIGTLLDKGSPKMTVIEMSATSVLAGTPIEVELGLAMLEGTPQYHLGLIVPDGVNFKALLPEFEEIADVMTKLKLGKSFLIFSNYPYKHDQLKIGIKKGLNIGAFVDFDNLLSDAKKILDKLSKAKTDFIIMDQLSAIFRATIDPSNIRNTSLGVELPLRIGVDLTKNPFNCGDCYIKKIYTANFVEQITMTGQASVQGGLTVELKDVADPLTFLVTLVVNPITEVIEIEGRAQGNYAPALGLKNLALGPILGVNFGLMSAPPWLKSFGIQAGFSLGSVIQGADGLIALDFAKGGVAFKFSLKKLDLDELVVLMTEVIENLKGISKEEFKKAVPPLEMSSLNVQFMPMAGVYFGVLYPAGLRMSLGELRIGPFAGGGELFIKGPKDALQALTKGSSVPPKTDDGSVGSLIAQATAPVNESLSVAKIEGHLFPFAVPKDKPIIKISGQSTVKVNDKVVDNCAQFLLDVTAGGGSKLLKGLMLRFLVTADIEIPVLKFKQHTYIVYNLFQGFIVQCSTKLGDDIFSGSVNLSFQPFKPQNFVLDMKFEQKFIEHIRAKVIRKIAENLAEIFEIRSASIHTSGEEIAKGKIATMSIDMTIFGKDIMIKDLVFDFTKIDDIAQAIVNKILELSAFHVNVANDTLYPIEAKCSKAGIWPTKGVTILPGETKRAEAGGADWANGLKVTIKAQKDIALKADFGPARPGNVDARVVAIPKFKIEKTGFILGKKQTTTYSIENMSFGVGIEFDISDEEFRYNCNK